MFAERPQVAATVVICHATGSESSPYVMIEVSVNAVNGTTTESLGDHLDNHTGPLWFPGAKAAGVEWGDIIPPVAGVTPGLNWPAGEATLNNECELSATGLLPTTGRGTSGLLLLGGVSVVVGAMLVSLRRKSGSPLTF